MEAIFEVIQASLIFKVLVVTGLIGFIGFGVMMLIATRRKEAVLKDCIKEVREITKMVSGHTKKIKEMVNDLAKETEE